jgi:hypothetical protein
MGIAVVRFRQPACAFVLIWWGGSLVPGMLSQPAPNFYRIVGAQVVTFIFPALALVEGWRYLRRRWPAGYGFYVVSAGGLALVLAVHLVASWRAYFDAWPQVEGVRFFWQSGLSEAARYLDDAGATMAGQTREKPPVALCTVLTYEHDPWWRPAWQSMRYLLQRDDLDIRYYDCHRTWVSPAGKGTRLYLFPDTAEPSTLVPEALQPAWLARATPIPNALPEGAGVALRVDAAPQAPLTGQAVWWAPEAGGGPAKPPVQFGDSLALLGYDLTPARPRPGETLRLVTRWEVLSTPPPRLVLFTHLLSDPQTLVAQQDGLALTTHSLCPGDHFTVLHDQVVVPADLPAGEYALSIGLYSGDTLARLPLYEGDQPRGDRLFLEPIQVVAP